MNLYYQSMVTHPFSVSRIQKQQGDVLPDVSPNSPILFPLHFVSKYETAKNSSRKNVIFENMFDLQVYRSSYRFRTHGPSGGGVSVSTVSPGTNRGPNCHCFHRSDWAQQSGRPSLTTQHLKMDGWKTTKTPFLGWLFGRSELLVSGGVTSLVLFFFWKVGSDYHWIRCGSSQDSSISHSPVVSS